MFYSPEALILAIGAVLLGVAIAWGALQYHRRNRANDAVTEAATKALYDDPEHYPERREKLRKRLRPS